MAEQEAPLIWRSLLLWFNGVYLYYIEHQKAKSIPQADYLFPYGVSETISPGDFTDAATACRWTRVYYLAILTCACKGC